MRDMKEKFGAEVERFRYAFVLPRHVPGWDEPSPEPRTLSFPALSGFPASGKPRKYIEVKPRNG